MKGKKNNGNRYLFRRRWRKRTQRVLCRSGGGAVRSVKEIYVGVGGVPKLVWSSGINPPNGVEGTYTAGEAISAGDFIILEGNTAYIAYCAPFHGIAKTSASSGSSITIIKPTGGA